MALLKQIVIIFLLMATLVLSATVIATARPMPVLGAPGDNGTPIAPAAECGSGGNCCGDVATTVGVDCGDAENPILGYLGGIMNFLAAGVGVVVVAMVTFAGVQYITSRGDPQKLSAAKGRLMNALIGLFCFIFLYAFLQWLLPSGLIGGGGGNSAPPVCEPNPTQGGPQPC